MPILPFTVNVCLPVCLGTYVVINNLIHLTASGLGYNGGRGRTVIGSNVLFDSNVVTNRNLINVLLTVLTMFNLSGTIGVSQFISTPISTFNNLILFTVVVLILLGFSI